MIEIGGADRATQPVSRPRFSQPRVAIVHYWLVAMRGGERVIEQLLDLYPGADLFTHVIAPDRMSPKIRAAKVTTSFINRLPMSQRLYQYYLPLMPMALEEFDLSDYDLVISSEAGPAKGVITGRAACTCATAIRPCATSGTIIISTRVRRTCWHAP